MVELLKKTLKPALQDYETCIVCLDWFAAHRDPTVAETIESLGHVFCCTAPALPLMSK